MRRLPMLFVMWAGGTAAAVLLGMFAVSLVGQRLTGPHLAPISKEQVAEERAAGPGAGPVLDDGAATAPGPSGSAPAESTDDDRLAGPGRDPQNAPGATTPAPGSSPAGGAGAPPAPGAPAPEPAAPSRESTGGGGSSGGPTSSTSGGGSGSNSSSGGPGSGGGGGPGPSGQSTTTTAAPAPSAPVTWNLRGGSVTATCMGATISVTTLSPSAGYVYDQSSKTAGADIDVKFRSSDGSHESEVRATCSGGVPSGTVREN